MKDAKNRILRSPNGILQEKSQDSIMRELMLTPQRLFDLMNLPDCIQP